MLQVREIMTPHVVTLSPDATLRDAIDTLATCRIGGAPVLEECRIVGVLSAPDVVRFESAARAPQGTDDTNDGATLDPAAEWSHGEPAPSRFFTELWPDNGLAITEHIEFGEGTDLDLLDGHVVREVMSRAVCTLPDTLDVSAAAQRMLAAGVQRALVTCEGELIGILTTTDILRAVAESRLAVRQLVFS